MATSYDYTEFQGVTNFGETQLLTELENNLKAYLDWSFLRIGAWTNVNISSTGGLDLYGGSPETLRWVDNPAYADGQVWQGFRKDWIYETGVNFSYSGQDYDPINVMTSGVEINGTFQTTGFFVNYPQGQIVFNDRIPTGSTVKAQFSYRNVQVNIADDVPWWKEIQLQSWRSDDIHFTQDHRTGDWSLGGHHRIQLPTIVIEAVPRGRSLGYELGNSALTVEQDVLCHILADSREMRNKLVSILETQNEHTIWLWDSDAVAAAEITPLDYRGERVHTNVYPDIVADSTYRWKKCRLKNIMVSEVGVINPLLYEGTVRITCEVVFGTI